MAVYRVDESNIHFAIGVRVRWKLLNMKPKVSPCTQELWIGEHLRRWRVHPLRTGEANVLALDIRKHTLNVLRRDNRVACVGPDAHLSYGL